MLNNRHTAIHRVLSWLLVLVMVISLVPAGIFSAQAAGTTNIKIHFHNKWNWTTPAIQYWGGSNTTVSGYAAGPQEISGWGGAQGYTMTKDGDWYTLTLTGDFEGFQFLDMAAPNDGNTGGKGYDSNMAQFNGDTATDLYMQWSDDGSQLYWYTDEACTKELGAPSGSETKTYTYTVHFSNPGSWSAVNGYAWAGSDYPLGAWPGSGATANAENSGWYDVTFTATASSVGLIFNNGGSSQTTDLTISAGDAEAVEAWVTGLNASNVSYAAPDGWKKAAYSTTIHFYNSNNWANVYAYVWQGASAVPGYESYYTWPGAKISENADHSGWYDLTITKEAADGFSFIFNSGSGSQTGDLSIATMEGVSELWYIGNTQYTSAPDGWDSGEVEVPTYTATIHYYNASSWSSVYAYIKEGAGWSAVEGCSEWPGNKLSENTEHPGWYTVTVSKSSDTYLNVIFNNNNGSQTADLKTGTLTENSVYWCVNNTLTDTEPSGWNGGDVEVPETYTATIHYHNTASWSEVALYAWDASGNYLLGAWPGTVVSENAANTGWYDAVVQTDANGFGFIFNNNGGGSQTGDLSTGTLTDNVELWVEGNTVSSTAPADWAVPSGLTIHFLKPDGWGSNINAYIWTDGGALAGYEAYNTWPGAPIFANATHAGWYDLFVAFEDSVSFNFIFNDGGSQTGDLSTGTITAPTELWVVDGVVSATAPGEWTGNLTYTALIHYQKPEGWNTVNAYVWNPFEGSGVAIPGYEDFFSWPGVTISENESNPGWYDLTVTKDSDTGFNFIFNNGSDSQTGNLWSDTLSKKTELWFYADETSTTTAPSGWFDPSRTVHVPGTFPGKSWDAASNQMTFDAELGLYVLTFENVPAGNYEYKIAINGTWTENYGVGGVKDGGNIGVTVPETMDVIVYYNDNTHYSVTNVTYVFADIDLVGTGIPEGTKLKDQGLTGIYSVSVTMAAGTYDDVKIVYGGQDYPFTTIELSEEKVVTFYMDPITGIYYNDASDVPLETEKVYYNSQEEAFKSPYGAVATGEEVTFSIETGTDVTVVALVIRGVATVQMEKNGEAVDGVQKWTGTVTIDNLGEYDYYFMLGNGATVAVYGDDDGYYGEGVVTELTQVLPYDIVVYQAGYETPDWVKNAVIYQIFPDRFYNGDTSNDQAQLHARGSVMYEFVSGEDWYMIPENPEQRASNPDTYPTDIARWGDGEWTNEIYGGDLQGIIEQIDYLKALGVNVIYLNPIFASISDHRYDASDYTQIDPILGTLGDFTELVEVAEANDMHIILDGVFNHVSDDSIYFDRYYRYLGTSEKIGAYPYWAYVYDYMNENGVDQETAEAAAVSHFTTEYGITDYSYTEWFEIYNLPMSGAVDSIGLRAGKSVYSYDGWWGYDSMPIIYSTNGSEYQTGNWAEEIIGNEDGTAVSQYWITQGNNGWRLDVANEVSDETWQHFRESVKALDSDVVIIGEIWDDATKYLMGDMYDSVMNYQFRNAVTSYAMGNTAENTTKTLEKIRERYPEEAFYAMMNLVGSHDTSRILSYLDGIGDDRADKSIEAAFPTYETTSDLAKERQYLVAFTQFTYAGAPTIYYGDEIGMVGADDPDDRRAFTWGKGNKDILTWYATLAAIRSEYSALRTGSVEPFSAGDSILGYVRRDDSGALVVLGNNAQTEVSVTVNLTELGIEAETVTDLITGTVYTVDNGTVTVTVAANRGVILTEEAVQVTIDLEALAVACEAEGYDYHTVTAEAGEGGTVTPEGAVTVWPGSSLSYTITAAEGYAISDVLVDGASVGAVERYVFENITADHTITAVFEAIPVIPGEPENPDEPEVPDTWENPFTDVKEGTWYYDAVEYLSRAGLVKGVEENVFGVYMTGDRGMVVTLLYRIAGCPAVEGTLEFSDVDPDRYYAKAVLWAQETGIAKGYGDGTFRPNEPVTREQRAVFLYRSAAGSGADVRGETFDPGFMDWNEAGNYAKTALLWAVDRDIMEGHGDGTLTPTDPVTRGQMAKMLYVLLDKVLN